MNRSTTRQSPPRPSVLGQCAAIGALGAFVMACGPAALAGPYPDKPIQLIAQQPPGSGSDAMTRVWADCAARELGQPVVVQNKPGANGVLAINALKGLPADGYNLMSIGMSQMTITPYVYRQMPYDPAKDFDGVAIFGTTPLVLVTHPGSGIHKLGDLPELAKKTPGGLNFGSPGKGSPAHLLTTALTDRMQTPSTHIPFVGEGAGLTALMGAQIQMMALVSSTALPQIKAGRLVPLAVFAPERTAALPEVPAITELLDAKDLARTAWIGIVAKAGTPPEMLARLSRVTQACLGDAGYQSRLQAMNVQPLATSAAEFKRWAERDSQVWRPLIDRLGLAE